MNIEKERELFRKSIIVSNWIDEFSFDNYYFIKDGKYAPVNIEDGDVTPFKNSYKAMIGAVE